MATVRKTLNLTEEAVAELERRHTLLVAAGKARTFSDTVSIILESRDLTPPSQTNYTVIDKSSLAELKREIVDETRLTALTVIRETLATEIAQGFKGFVAAMRDDISKRK